jgi:hypothetical protein
VVLSKWTWMRRCWRRRDGMGWAEVWRVQLQLATELTAAGGHTGSKERRGAEVVVLVVVLVAVMMMMSCCSDGCAHQSGLVVLLSEGSVRRPGRTQASCCTVRHCRGLSLASQEQEGTCSCAIAIAIAIMRCATP